MAVLPSHLMSGIRNQLRNVLSTIDLTGLASTNINGQIMLILYHPVEVIVYCLTKAPILSHTHL